MPELVGLLDTNVFLRYIMQDRVEHAEAANQFFARIEQQEISVWTTDTVIFECVFTMEKLFRVPRPVIADAMNAILANPGIVLPGKENYLEIFDLWTRTMRLSFADAYHLIITRELGLERIISFDRGLHGVDGVTRVEPPLA